MSIDKTIEKAINKALADPEFMLAINRRQKAIKIEAGHLRTKNERSPLYYAAKKHGLSVHIENEYAYLYVD